LLVAFASSFAKYRKYQSTENFVPTEIRCFAKLQASNRPHTINPSSSDSVHRYGLHQFGPKLSSTLDDTLCAPAFVGTLNIQISGDSDLVEAAMPSRKKAKGQARKAAKVKKEEELLADKARQLEEKFHRVEQSQIQRLQINNAQSPVPTTCLHGFDPFPNNHICSKFIRAFVHEYYKCLHNIYTDGCEDERAVIACLLEARESTQNEYSDVWNSADKMKQGYPTLYTMERYFF
jgi:hypothetical protein